MSSRLNNASRHVEAIIIPYTDVANHIHDLMDILVVIIFIQDINWVFIVCGGRVTQNFLRDKARHPSAGLQRV